MQKKCILITGGTGYIGSHAVVAFEQAGYTTVIVDNLVNSSITTLSGIEKILGYCPDFFESDIRDSPWLERMFQKYEFDGVIHFAGLKAVGESCQNIGLYHDNNIRGSMILFETMEKFGVKKIVFSSSATVYRSDNPVPFSEEMPTGTTNPYGTTKLVIEKLLEDYVENANWSATSLRYFNPIGAHISWYIGEVPRGTPNNLLPYVLEVALWKRETVYIYGNDYETPDGTGVRDYIDINDLIDAHLLSYEKLFPGYSFYNVGTGKGTSVLEMIEKVEQVSEKQVSYSFSPRRSWDLACVFADVRKIQIEMNWSAQRNATESIKAAWNFIKNRVE